MEEVLPGERVLLEPFHRPSHPATSCSSSPALTPASAPATRNTAHRPARPLTPPAPSRGTTQDTRRARRTVTFSPFLAEELTARLDTYPGEKKNLEIHRPRRRAARPARVPSPFLVPAPIRTAFTRPLKRRNPLQNTGDFETDSPRASLRGAEGI